MANAVEKLDTSIRIVTPENIAFEYRVAGPFRRAAAYAIDQVVCVVVFIAGTIILMITLGAARLELVGAGMVAVLWFLLTWFYGGVLEAYWNGQTPGKRLMQIRVLSVDGQPINGVQAVLRNILRTVDAQPLWFYQVGLWATLSNDRFQRLGDWACGTMVVVEEHAGLAGVLQTREPDAIRLVDQIPAHFRVSRTLARALAVYVERRVMFSWPRRVEIARHLAEPLRVEFGMPPDTNPDLLLCALYHREFIAERASQSDRSAAPLMEPQSPFAPLAGEVIEIAVSP